MWSYTILVLLAAASVASLTMSSIALAYINDLNSKDDKATTMIQETNVKVNATQLTVSNTTTLHVGALSSAFTGCTGTACARAGQLSVERLYMGGFKATAEAAVDAFLKNGDLLKKLPVNQDKEDFTSLAFVSISARKGSTYFHKTYGVEPRSKKPYTPTSTVSSPYYSSTKLVANILGVMFVEKGAIDLDEPCHRYLPETHTDLDVKNANSIKPLVVIRPLPAGTSPNATTVTVGGATYPIKEHVMSANAGASAGVAHRYFEEPVANDDYPTLRQFMTHTDGMAGYFSFAAPYWAAAPVVPSYFLAHAIVADRHGAVCQPAYPHTFLFGAGFDCEPANTTNAAMTKAHFDVGALIAYPGKANHYSWSNAIVGRACEVAYNILNGKSVFDLTTRFEDVLKTELLDKVGATRSAFYAADPSSELYKFYNSTYAEGVVGNATPASDPNVHNYILPATPGLRTTFPTTVVRALGDAGMISTAEDYLKIMSVLTNGLAPDGTRIMRASSARMLSTHHMSHKHNEDEVAFGTAYIYGTVRTLGGAMKAELVEPDKYHPMHSTMYYKFGDQDMPVRVTRNGLSMDAMGIDTTSWGGAAGTKWYANVDDDMLFSLQTNVNPSSHPDYLAQKVYGILSTHSY